MSSGSLENRQLHETITSSASSRTCTVSVDNSQPVLSARTISWQKPVKFSLQDGKYLKHYCI
ncbi:hypothetical protein RH63_19315 [Salmonella enterica]|nr:hypothetical protein [Salmonella enterica]EBP8094481.1 hypothetical protein [Salmonella enterica]